MRYSNSNISSSNIILTNLIFILLNSGNNNGGAININQNNLNFQLFYCSFFNCSSNLNGGAIYFDSNLGISKLFCIFGKYTFSPSESFFHISLISNNNNDNHCNFTSLSYSSFDMNSRWCLLNLYYGNQIFNTYNGSYNKIGDHGAGPAFFYPNNSSLIYSTIFNCFSDILQGNVGLLTNSIYENCNFINNSKSLNRYGYIDMNTNGKNIHLKNFIFQNNIWTLFYAQKGSITIENCFFDFYSYAGNSPLIISYITNTLMNYRIYFQNCNLILTNNILFNSFHILLLFLNINLLQN